MLLAHVPLFSRLPETDRKELESLAQIFLAEKAFEGCGGFSLTKAIKLAIAVQACVLLLHRNTDVFPDLRSILVYPTRYSAHAIEHLGSGVLDERHVVRAGEAWTHGAVVLAWDAVLADLSHARGNGNIVLHEFAHLLDFEDGHVNGAPAFQFGKSQADAKARHASWTRTLNTEYEKLRAQSEKGEPTYLNVYGATNPAEFFAVATETFFEQPHQMRTGSPDLFAEFKKFYRQDPSQWPALSPSTPSSTETRG